MLSVAPIAQVGQKRVVKISMFPPHEREERLRPLSKGRDKFLRRRRWRAGATSAPRGRNPRRPAGAPPPPSHLLLHLLIFSFCSWSDWCSVTTGWLFSGGFLEALGAAFIACHDPGGRPQEAEGDPVVQCAC